MQNNLFTILLFLVPIGVSATEQLAVMQDLGADRYDFTVIGQIDNYYFILADDHELLRINRYKRPCIILDNNPRENFYLFVWTSEANESIVTQYGTVLGYFNKCFLIRTTERNVILLNNHSFELSRLSSTPLRWSRPCLYENNLLNDTMNSLIEKMVEKVSEDSIRSFIRKLQNFETRYCSSEVNRNEVCPWVYGQLKHFKCDSVYFHDFDEEYGPNIIGIKRGKVDSSYTSYCILGGHIDDAPSTGRAPGADDNASGTAIMLEVARIMEKYQFNNTIQFHGWNAEECGMRGSDAFTYYADNENHTIIGGALNFDMVGCTEHGPNVEIYYNTNVEGCEDFALNRVKPVIDMYTDLNYVLLNNNSTPTDHVSFWKKGFLAVGGVENRYSSNITYHEPFDTLDHPQGLNNTKHVTEVAKAALALLATFAVPYNISPIKMTQGPFLLNKPILTYHKGKVRITINPSNKNEQMGLQVFDLSGRLMKTILPEKKRDGNYTFIWGGLNLNGHRTTSGLYILIIKAKSQDVLGEFVLPFL